MKRRNLREIVKEVAQRYGLKYDENQSEMIVRLEDGTLRTVSKEDFEKVFKWTIRRFTSSKKRGGEVWRSGWLISIIYL